MVNPVGSLQTKYWYKKWISVKEKVSLGEEQRSLIIGSLLGDGTMRVGEGSKNANFKVEQGLDQKDFVFWKYSYLRDLVFTEPKLSYRYLADGTMYEKSWWFRTIRHPILTQIYKRFYVGDGYRTGRKIVPIDIESDLNPLALGIWIMDDGSFSKGKIDISTYSFRLEEILLLERVFEQKFGLLAKHYRDRNKGYRMYFNMGETQKLISIIRLHIIPSMEYKIGLITP